MEIDKILARSWEDGYYLVKWKHVSIVHAHWLSTEEILLSGMKPATLSRLAEGLPRLEKEQDEWGSPEDLISVFVKERFAHQIIPERILARCEMPSLPENDPCHYLPPPLHQFYLKAETERGFGVAEAILVKWKGLSVLDSTWEWADEDKKVKFPPTPLLPEPKFPKTIALDWMIERMERSEAFEFDNEESVGETERALLAIAIVRSPFKLMPTLVITDSIEEWDVRLQSFGMPSGAIWVFHDPRGKPGRDMLLKHIPENLKVVLTTSNVWDGAGGKQAYKRQQKRPDFHVIVTDGFRGRDKTKKKKNSGFVVDFQGNTAPGDSMISFSETNLILGYLDQIRLQIIQEGEKPGSFPKVQLEKWKSQLDLLCQPPYSFPVASSVKARISQLLHARGAEKPSPIRSQVPDPDPSKKKKSKKRPAAAAAAGSGVPPDAASSKKPKRSVTIPLTPYEILGVRVTASHEEIRKAFRMGVRRTHPDKCPGREREFQQIMEAFRSICH